MPKKTKRILIKRKIKIAITVNNRVSIIGVCENCQREQVFEVAEIHETNQINEATEVKKLNQLTEEKKDYYEKQSNL